MTITKVNLRDGFDSFDEQYTPFLGAELNDHAVKLVKVEGAFPWHHHDGIDELFYVIKDEVSIEIHDVPDVTLGEGELVVVLALNTVRSLWRKLRVS